MLKQYCVTCHNERAKTGDLVLDPATVTELIRRLRLKIEAEPDRPRWIQTVRGERPMTERALDHVYGYADALADSVVRPVGQLAAVWVLVAGRRD